MLTVANILILLSYAPKDQVSRSLKFGLLFEMAIFDNQPKIASLIANLVDTNILKEKNNYIIT